MKTIILVISKVVDGIKEEIQQETYNYLESDTNAIAVDVIYDNFKFLC